MSTQLCINITGTSAFFAEVLRSNKTVVATFTLHFTNYIENERKEELSRFIKENKLNKEYAEYSLALWDNKYTLVPFNLLDSKNYTDAFKLCFGEQVSNKEIDYNMLPHFGVSNIFHIPLWIKSFFVIKYPRITVQHCASLCLNGMNEEPNFKPNIEVLLDENYFYLNIFAKNDLKFSNAYDYQNNADIIYHTMYVLQQLELTQNKGNLHIASLQKEADLSLLETEFSQFQELKEMQIAINNNRILNHHLQCV